MNSITRNRTAVQSFSGNSGRPDGGALVKFLQFRKFLYTNPDSCAILYRVSSGTAGGLGDMLPFFSSVSGICRLPPWVPTFFAILYFSGLRRAFSAGQINGQSLYCGQRVWRYQTSAGETGPGRPRASLLCVRSFYRKDFCHYILERAKESLNLWQKN